MIRLVVAVGVLGLVSVGETYLFLELQDRDNLALKYFPLLIVGMNLAYLLLAIPLGRLADNIGRWRVYTGGYVALIVAYLCAGGPLSGPPATYLCLLMLGGYYAATDGVGAAMAGRLSGPEVRSSAIAITQTTVALTSAFSALGFALLWASVGRAHALAIVALLLAVVLPFAAFLLRGADPAPTGVDRTALADS
jgi:MFS family permease